MHRPCRFYKREIGVYDFAKDRTVGYKCPDCGGNPVSPNLAPRSYVSDNLG